MMEEDKMAEGEAKMLVNTMSFTTPGQYKVGVCAFLYSGLLVSDTF